MTNPFSLTQPISTTPTVSVLPEHNIIFFCRKRNTVGIIQIYTTSTNQRSLQFQMKTTNKRHYKVSEASGYITRSPYYIYIYLQQHCQIEDILNDKFKITIIDNRKIKSIFSAKLGVVILPSLVKLKENSLAFPHINMEKKSQKHENSEILNEWKYHNIENKSSMKKVNNEGKGKLRSQREQAEQNYLQCLKNSRILLDRKKRKELKLEEKVESKKAKQRLVMCFFILIIVIGFVAGFQLNKFADSETVSGMRQKLRQYFQDVKND